MGSAAAGVLGAGMSIYGAIKDGKDKKAAADALANLQQPELKNVAENMTVSTMGADLQKEEQARLAATQVDALAGSGTRGIIGGIGRVEAGNQKVNAEVAANLDQQQKDIDKMYANDEQNIRNINEDRHNANVSALSSQYDAANNSQKQNIGNIVQSAGMIAGGISAAKGTGATTTATAQPTEATKPPLTAQTGTIQPQTVAYSPTSSRPRMGGLGAVQYDAYGQPIQ